MSINSTQFRELIEDVLKDVDLYSEDAVELLMLTAAQESHLGTYLKQVGGGPARGIFQIEEGTEDDIWNNYIFYREELESKIHWYLTDDVENDMVYNIAYQIIMARIHYLRVPEPLPSRLDISAMADYYKRYFNTNKGKATVEEAITNYKRLCV